MLLWIWILVHIIGPSNSMPHLQDTHAHIHTQCTHCVHMEYAKLTFLIFSICFGIFLMYFDIFGFVFAKNKNMCHRSPDSCCYLLKNGQPGQFWTNKSTTGRHLRFCLCRLKHSWWKSPHWHHLLTITCFIQIQRYIYLFEITSNLTNSQTSWEIQKQ